MIFLKFPIRIACNGIAFYLKDNNINCDLQIYAADTRMEIFM